MTELRALERRHWALVRERTQALSKAVERVDPATQLKIIERFNVDPYYENQFDDIAIQIRELDPNHSFLPENNPE